MKIIRPRNPQWRLQPIHSYRMRFEGKTVGEFSIASCCDHLYFADFDVNKEYRNRGFGSQALEFVKQLAKRYKLPIRLAVNANNKAAIRLYRRHGFKNYGTPGDINRMQWSDHARIGV